MSNVLKFAALAAVLLCGCAKPEDKFVGHYNGSLQLSQSAQAQLSKAPPQVAAMLKDQLGGLKMELELRKDRTYTVNATLPVVQAPGQTASNSKSSNDVSIGTWTLKDNRLTLTDTSETVDGKAIPPKDDKPEVLVVGADPKILTADMSSNPQASQLGSLVFTKTN